MFQHHLVLGALNLKDFSEGFRVDPLVPNQVAGLLEICGVLLFLS
jgi:hypothetical protein